MGPTQLTAPAATLDEHGTEAIIECMTLNSWSETHGDNNNISPLTFLLMFMAGAFSIVAVTVGLAVFFR